MKRLVIALAIVALGSPALADPPAKTQPKKAGKAAKTVQPDAFKDLNKQAKSSNFVLGERRMAGPAALEVERFEVQRLSNKAVDRVIAEHKEEVKYCLDLAAARGKSVGGEVSLKFAVTPDGRATQILVVSEEGAPADKALDGCLARAVRRWKFPEADSQTAVDYPLVVSGEAK